MCSASGLLATGTIGFGKLLVSGRSRVPEPPAIITAFIRVYPRLYSRLVLYVETRRREIVCCLSACLLVLLTYYCAIDLSCQLGDHFPVICLHNALMSTLTYS